MRFREISGGLRVAVTNEQEQLVKMIDKKGKVKKKDLDERQQEIARLLTSRGVLKRVELDDGFYYRVNTINDAWRL